MKLNKLIPATLVALMTCGGIAAQSLEDVVQADILNGWRAQDGSHIAALRIRLSPGWKTYWRTPGDAGIPPRITWRGSHNMRNAEITWPTPVVFDQNGMRSIGYKEEVILPLRINPDDIDGPIHLNGKLEIGVCSDICVPQTLKVSADLTSDNVKPVPAIAAALASRPFSASEAGVQSATCRMSPTSGGISVTATVRVPSTGGQETVVIEANNPQIWVTEAKSQRNGGTITATADLMHQDGDAFLVDRSELRITVLGRKHAVDIRGCNAG